MNWRTMKRPRISTVAGVSVALLGCWWTGTFLLVFVSDSTLQPFDWIEALFMLLFGVITLTPGILAAVFGFRLIRTKTEANVRRTSGSLAVMGAMYLTAHLSGLLSFVFHSESVFGLMSVSMLLSTLLGIGLYVSLSLFMMRKEGIALRSVGSLVGRGLVFLVALEMYLAGANAASYAPLLDGYAQLDELQWHAVIHLGAILLAVTVYQVLVRVLKIRNRPTEFRLPDSHAPGAEECRG